MGLASGVIGAAGGIGGFLLPLCLGGLKDVTGTYATGLSCFAVAAVCALLTVMAAQRRAAMVAG
jgi:MFS transporter, NNP family, nitrate/nitrite transporter